MSAAYIRGLLVTFFLIFGLVSLLDMVFSTVNLGEALAFAQFADIRRRRREITQIETFLRNALDIYEQY